VSQRPNEPRDAATAVRRFGLGPKPGDIARIAADPRGYVLAGLSNPALARIEASQVLASTPKVFAEIEEARVEQAFIKAFGQSTHWDPGPNFPVAAFIQQVVQGISPSAPPTDVS